MEKFKFINKNTQKVFDAILTAKPTLNYSILKTALRKKDIKVNGTKIKENVEIEMDDKVEIFLREKKDKKIDIVFEDENVLLAFKPAGIETTQKDKTFVNSKSLEELTKAVACHRLDKNTEGIVILAKNQMAENSVIDAFKTGNIKKEYLAIVFGKVNPNGENLVNYLKKEQNFVKICKKNDENAKIAKLSYNVINSKNNLHLIRINLETGRTHQIRVQLAGKGIFVLGDEKYGDKQVNKKYKKSKQQLCAYKITFKNLTAPLKYLEGKSFEIEPNFKLDDFI